MSSFQDFPAVRVSSPCAAACPAVTTAYDYLDAVLQFVKALWAVPKKTAHPCYWGFYGGIQKISYKNIKIYLHSIIYIYMYANVITQTNVSIYVYTYI